MQKKARVTYTLKNQEIIEQDSILIEIEISDDALSADGTLRTRIAATAWVHPENEVISSQISKFGIHCMDIEIDGIAYLCEPSSIGTLDPLRIRTSLR